MVLREDLPHVGVADPLGPLEEAPVAGHRREAHERLERVAVQLGAGVGQRAEVARDRRVPHQVGRHVRHAVEPGRAAEQLGDRDEPVLGVLRGAEEARRAELARLEVEVGRDAVLRVRVADLVAQHLAQAALVERPVREPGGGHEVRVVVRPGVVRPVDVQALRPAGRPGEDVGQQERALVGVREPRVRHPARAPEDLLHADAVLGRPAEGRLLPRLGRAGRDGRPGRSRESRQSDRGRPEHTLDSRLVSTSWNLPEAASTAFYSTRNDTCLWAFALPAVTTTRST